jgi:ribonuclease T2
MIIRAFRSLLALAAIASAAPVSALDNGCLLDRCADQAPPAVSPSAPAPSAAGERPRFGAPAASGEFDFYVLALSWSAGFCELSGGAKSQCEPGSKLAFVVHGLWPQYEHGFPSNCGGSPTVSRIALERARGVYPDDGLARYEWRKHGTCSGLSPGDYFESVARARNAVTIPSSFASIAADETLATLDIERAFLDANPRLRPGMMSVGCERGLLQEVRICFSKDLRDFRACPEVARRGCHAREIRVPAPY